MSFQNLQKFMLGNGFKKEQIVLTSNGIENDLIMSARRDDRYKIDALFTGRINETKGIYDMLKVLKIVTREYPDFRLAIMGNGDKITEKNFKNEIKTAGLENNVQFLGYITGQEKFNIIKSSGCFWFLSLSKHESFGIALMEAVCSGIPAFCYNLDPFKKLYKNNEVFMFRKHDYRSVAQGVIDMFKDESFKNRKGELLLGKYSWDNIADIEYSSIKNL